MEEIKTKTLVEKVDEVYDAFHESDKKKIKKFRVPRRGRVSKRQSRNGYTTILRIGHITPGDSVLSCDASDESVSSGYWYYPPAYYTDTSQSVLVEPGHYVTTATLNTLVGYYTGSVFIPSPPPGYTQYNYAEYKNGVFVRNAAFTSYQGSSYSSSWYTYTQTWVPDRYETVQSGYWTYPPAEWIQTGNPGEVSCIFLSIADTMIGSVYVTRPLCC